MSFVEALLPAEHASKHVLVLPHVPATTLPELAEAWFPGVGWLQEPTLVPRSKPAAGARFRGVQTETTTGPGLLALGEEHCVAGPYQVPAEVAARLDLGPGDAVAFGLGRTDGTLDARGGRPAAYDDRDGIARAFASALPEGMEMRVVQWGVAVARKLGGVVLADGREVLRPDPAASVDLSLFSAHALTPAELLTMLRSIIATAELEAESTTPNGAVQYQLVARTTYDGALVAHVEHVDRVPRSLGALEWRTYGPFAYHFAWLPQDPYELQTEQPSGVHVIARGRMRGLVARLAAIVQGRIGGVLVDDGGFIVSQAELERRQATPGTNGTRAWV
jgi:hypothetical protein